MGNMDETQLFERLRDRLVTALHVGRVRPGDRLPGIREVSREVGANPRTVAKAYRRLQEEGLVEVRGRSGVYAALQDHWGGTLLAETGRWLGGVLLEGWKRNIPIPDLADLIRNCTVRGVIRAVCVDDTEDDLAAICAELEESFGLTCEGVHASNLSTSRQRRARLPEALRRADLIVATAYVARSVRPASEALNVPMVTISLHPERVRAIDRLVQDGELIVVCADRAFGEKVRSRYPEEVRDRIRIVPLSHATIGDLGGDSVLLTRAAKDRLGDRAPIPRVPIVPFISPESAGAITELMVRIQMEREHGGR